MTVNCWLDYSVCLVCTLQLHQLTILSICKWLNLPKKRLENRFDRYRRHVIKLANWRMLIATVENITLECESVDWRNLLAGSSLSCGPVILISAITFASLSDDVIWRKATLCLQKLYIIISLITSLSQQKQKFSAWSKKVSLCRLISTTPIKTCQ